MQVGAVTSLVIGSEGFIGRTFCEYLSYYDDVVRFDLVLGDDARWQRLPQADKVYFLAWDVGGAKYLYDPRTQRDQLEWNTALLNNVMPQLDAPFVFASSQLAGDGSVYGTLKLLGEQWTALLGGTSVRLWNVYGPHEQMTRRSHVVSDFFEQAKTGTILMWTTGEERRQFVHIDDVCEALRTATGQGDVTTGVWTSVVELAHLIAAHYGAQVVPGREKGRTQPHTPDILPGWTAKVSLEEGLRRMK